MEGLHKIRYSQEFNRYVIESVFLNKEMWYKTDLDFISICVEVICIFKYFNILDT